MKTKKLKASDPITIKLVNSLIDRLNILSNIRGRNGVTAKLTSGGVAIRGKSPSSLGLVRAGILRENPVAKDNIKFHLYSNGQEVSADEVYDAWDSGTTYSAGDKISHDSINYEARQGNTSQEPPNTTYWGVLISGLDCYAIISNGTRLDMASPRLASGQDVMVTRQNVGDGERWYFTFNFNGTEDFTT